MSGSQELAKLLSEDGEDDSTESDGEGTKKLPDLTFPEPTVPHRSVLTSEDPGTPGETQQQLDQAELPPPYELGGIGNTAEPTAIGTDYPQWSSYGGAPPPVTTPPHVFHSSVHNQTTVVQVQPYSVTHVPPCPPNYVGLAIFATLCCFWPLGIAALIKSSEVNKLHGMGSYELARQSSMKARHYAKLSIIIGIIVNVVVGAFMGAYFGFRVIGIRSYEY